MSKTKGLDHSAYGGVPGDKYVPYVSAQEVMPESTVTAILFGVIFAIVFAAANTYLGLKVGMTIAAGIPVSILATGLLRFIFRRNNILEANMIQSIAAMGESIAGGIIFTLPAIIIWGLDLKLSTIVIATLLGGLVGIFFVVPLRRYLVIEEHGKLVFPESMAAAEILVTGSSGGAGFRTVLTGLSIGGIYKLLSGGFKLWLEEPEWTIKPMQNTIFGMDTLASLAGVGFIIGVDASLYMFAGAFVAWLGLIPLIKYFGAGLVTPLFPSKLPISQMDAWGIWSNYIRYIGAGAVAAGGFISLGRSLPTIVQSFKSAVGGLGKGVASNDRTNQDAPIIWVIASAILVFLLSWILPGISIGAIGSLMVILFTFFFAVVSARMVGIIGASNNPVSGMTIATLLFITSILKLTGYSGTSGSIAAITAGAIVCIAIAVAGGAAQSLKTTYIIGGTPKRVEFGMYLGLAFASVFAGLVLLMLHNTYGIGSREVAAPQATLMSMVVKGVMLGQLPWDLVLVGAVFGVMVALMGLPILPVALGLYLPIHLSSAILVGGIVRALVEGRYKQHQDQLKKQVEKGILLASGLVAGDAIMDIIVAIFATINLNIALGSAFIPSISKNPLTAAIAFFLLVLWMYRYSIKQDQD